MRRTAVRPQNAPKRRKRIFVCSLSAGENPAPGKRTKTLASQTTVRAGVLASMAVAYVMAASRRHSAFFLRGCSHVGHAEPF
ncbi:protein of unknown function [Candidatus Filomicrobium marinum]|uniref:Uncharacterized protein n=1 Tax=Candidatus Filomicrobium marinum TaxID=1608628 RepID=A0A0D6JID3_9HYPH|nr:protein of unknown function [Candidatus Filomicrobium marinum]CPR21072.1 protein of unknown function [Candidatus Filomicrobium marinum]